MKETIDLAFDTEANDLLEGVTKVWCVVAENIKTHELFIFHDYPQYNNAKVFDPYDKEEYIIPKRNGTLEEGIKFLMEAGGKLIAHNALGYDHFLMKKFFKFFEVKLSRYRDTLIQSKVQWYDRPTPKGCKGAHGLQAYGVREGIHKPEVNDWSVFDPFKLHRCIQDVRIQTKTYFRLEKERENIKKLTGDNLEECLANEHKYRYEATLQELRGAPVDREHIINCVRELDNFTEELREKIEPNLPPTVKFKATKDTAHDMCSAMKEAIPELWGDRKIPAIRYEVKERSGVKKQYPIKQWYKPVTKFSTTKKTKVYAAVNTQLDVKTEFIFEKLKFAREWVKENYTDVKGWKYPSEELEVSYYNSHTCSHFDVEPEDFTTRKDYQIVGPHTKVEFITSKMSQHAIVKAYLVSLGWKPTEWNLKKDSEGKVVRATERTYHRWPEKASKKNQVEVVIPRGQALLGAPKLTEDSYDSLSEGIGKDIANFNTYSHRRKFLENPTDKTKGLLNNIREDGRISCGINCFGTATGRS